MHSNSLGISFPLAHSAGFNSYFPAAADFPYLYKMRSNGNAEFYKYRLGCFYYPGEKVYWNTHSYITRDGRSFGICKTTGGTPGTTAGGGGGGGGSTGKCPEPNEWIDGRQCRFEGKNRPCMAIPDVTTGENCDNFCRKQEPKRRCTGGWENKRSFLGTICERDTRIGCLANFTLLGTEFCECGCTSEGLTVSLTDK